MDVRTIFIAGVFMAAPGCVMGPAGTDPVSPRIRDAVAACGAGFSSGTRAELVAALEDNGGNLTAEVTQRMRAAILDDFEVTEANAATVYQTYEGCISRMLS